MRNGFMATFSRRSRQAPRVRAVLSLLDTTRAILFHSPLMKPKFWTIENGSLVPVSHFARGLNPIEIEAPTKGEALTILLSRMEKAAKLDGARLYVKGGAYALSVPAIDGSGYAVEGGTLHARRRQHTGAQFPLVTGFVAPDAKPADVMRAASLDYYGSEEFAREEARAEAV